MPTQSVYRVEKAKSSRSKCKGACKQAIPRDALRFGSAGDALHGTYFWRCMGCITSQQVISAEEVHGSLEKIPGLEELPEDERKTAISRLNACKQAGEDTGSKMKTKDRSSEKENIKPVEGEGAEERPAHPTKVKGKSVAGKRKKAEAERGETGTDSEGGVHIDEGGEGSGLDQVEGRRASSEEVPAKKAAVQV